MPHINSDYFSLSADVIPTNEFHRQFQNARMGALCAFEGLVRNHNDGESVLSLTYEAHEKISEQEAFQIFAEARHKFSILKIKCVHRVGQLQIGDAAVWVGVSAEHRDDAFKACRYIIDELKLRLPIWKKEFYQHGESEWLEPTPSSFNYDNYHCQQMKLAEIGRAGQEQLRNAKVLVIGAGGLGSACLPNLAGSGIGTMGICEYDFLDESNLHRQTIYQHKDIGRHKIDLAHDFLKSLNPAIQIKKHPEQLTSFNIKEIFLSYDLIIDCTDNFDTKYLINSTAIQLKKPYVSACVYQFEGQLMFYTPDQTPCLRCLWPDPLATKSTANCSESGVLGPIVSILGGIQSAEAIKYLLGLPILKNEILIFNGLTSDLRKIKLCKSQTCPDCSPASAQDVLAPTDVEIDLMNLKTTHPPNVIWIDLREPMEKLFGTEIPNVVDWPLNQIDLPQMKTMMDPDKTYFLFCAKGVRSLKTVLKLRDSHLSNAYSVIGGSSSVLKHFNQIQQRKYENA